MARPAQLGRAGLFALLVWLPFFNPLLARAAAKADAANVADLVRRAVENYKARQAQRDNYTYLERIVRAEFDRNGKARGHITGTYEIMFLKGAPYRRLIRVNDEPLSPQQEKIEQQQLEAETRMREAGKGDPKPFTSLFSPVAQLMEGFQLRQHGRQILNGHQVQVIEALPDEKHPPATPEQGYAHHFRMKFWVDAAEAQIVRVEARVIGESVAFDQEWMGFYGDGSSADAQFLSEKHRVEVARGTVSEMEWTKVNGDAWLPKRSYWKTKKMTVTFSSPAKPLSFPVEVTSSYSAYKKFRVDTRIVPE